MFVLEPSAGKMQMEEGTDKSLLREDILFDELDSYFNLMCNVMFDEDQLFNEKSVTLRGRKMLARFNQICRYLTHRKVYIPIHNDNDNEMQLLYQNKVIVDFWNYCNEKISQLEACFLEKLYNEYGTMKSEAVHVLGLWQGLYGRYKICLECFEPVLGYPILNYNTILKIAPQDSQVLKHAGYSFTKRLEGKFGSKFIPFLRQFLLELRSSKLTVLDENITETLPLKLFHEYDVPVNGNSASEFYLEDLSTFIDEGKLTLKLDEDFFVNLLDLLKLNGWISYHISEELVSKGNNIIIEKLLLKKDVVMQLATVFFPLTVGTIEENMIKRFTKRLEFEGAIHAFEKRKRITEFIDIISEFVRSELTRPFENGKIESFFNTIFSLDSFIGYNDVLKDMIRKCANDTAGGELKLMELYVKFCEIAIYKVDKELGNSTTVKNFQLTPLYSAPLELPELLKFRASFLNLYTRTFFKRLIMNGQNMLNDLFKDSSYESLLMRMFEQYYKNSNELQDLLTLLDEMRKLHKFNEQFQATEISKLADTIILEKSKLASSLQEASDDTLKLPSELQGIWDNIVSFYKSQDKNGSEKSIKPIYYLQHCEVESPFFVQTNNGSKKLLIFELNIFQTCVLGEFNENDSASFNELLRKLKMKETTLKSVMRSFLNVGLLQNVNDRFSINVHYVPDMKKVRKGKLRIPLPKPSQKLSNSRRTSMVAEHHEGLRSQWKQELLQACIVRSLKGLTDGLAYSMLFDTVKQQLPGFSVGEFKDALSIVVRDHIVTEQDNIYKYK
ncbi:hypothetical protein KAFR_0A00890 [Kazachstania africana CBS 2517]|uniref:Cullin family profile domain-containing protein n=1 Tax=Kazachstania africana (strain ATCC 22294 / BCRC 22015 / CBS 2517 / CECT 1963 / NBRC 1671 / NRRL Y-8276) TaxID=1071382 RepID=H2AMC7_KAZAF|nr:hypothetical protein KAFR_0A00890 [Kazachstania africana CBS 2517]CCF55527.1 hypothetical protein KAFR_0A00890 [Kazachstania africana CBS 2517]